MRQAGPAASCLDHLQEKIGALETGRLEPLEEPGKQNDGAEGCSQSPPRVRDADRFNDIGQRRITGIAISLRRDPDLRDRHETQKFPDPIAIAGYPAQNAVQRRGRQLGNLSRDGQLLSVLQIHDMDIGRPRPMASVGLRPPAKVDGKVAIGEIGVPGALESDPDLPRARLPMSKGINRGFYLRQKRMRAVEVSRLIGSPVVAGRDQRRHGNGYGKPQTDRQRRMRNPRSEPAVPSRRRVLFTTCDTHGPLPTNEGLIRAKRGALGKLIAAPNTNLAPPPPKACELLHTLENLFRTSAQSTCQRG